MADNANQAPERKAKEWDNSSHDEFYEYYKDESLSPRALQRFKAIQATILRLLTEAQGEISRPLEVADIGCGAGTQSAIWAELGHHAYGVDVNEPLIELARERAAQTNNKPQFQVGSATELPWSDASMDVCLMPELLEHVPNWQACLDECARILRPGGILFLSTTNKLCPVQQEFNLPAYSWYPRPLKRYFERLASTSRPHLAGYRHTRR